MLQELDIKNYALIDHLHINFADGFSVITGETGSGKSILLGALALILGERADIKSIRNKTDKCIIEGVFKLSQTELEPFFKEHDLDFDITTIIRREISSQGKSRAFINDTPVSLGTLKSLSEQLIDIHSQHATLLLNDKNFVFDIIDSQFTNDILTKYSTLYAEYKTLGNTLQDLLEKEQKSLNDKSYYEFLLTEFEELDLQKAIDADLESEYNLLSNAEDVKKSLYQCQNYLNNDSNSIISNLHSVATELDKIKHLNSQFAELSERVNSSLIELQDIEHEIASQEDNIEVDNLKLIQLENELSKINGLLKKHNVNSIIELSEHKSEIENKLSQIGSISAEIQKVQSKINNVKTKLLSLANDLTKQRNKIIPNLEKSAQGLLAQMKMSNAQIQFKLSPTGDFTKHGLDNIELLAKTNLGGDFELLKKIASGGESSRIMLAIKSLQSQNKALPTIIFDEIDTGVSGEVATNMGSIMKTLGEKMQVMSITHLPQIASKGKHHYKVFKEEANKTTFTRITQLNEDERINEIAQMLSSNEITQVSIENAKELLNK